MKPAWAVISVPCRPEAAEAVHAALLDFTGRGTAEIPAGGGHVLVQAFVPAEGHLGDIMLKLTDLLSAVREQIGEAAVAAPAVQLLADEDWSEAWKRHYRPLRVGRILIRPSWHPHQAQGEGVIEIVLDPQIAFGTGAHASTQLALLALQRTVGPGCRVADVGTGTGILAIAAAKLGAEHVWATDIDELAAEAAQNNVKLNGVADKVAVAQADLLGDAEGRFDIIVANIAPRQVKQLANMAPDRLVPGGFYLPGGYTRISEADVHQTIEAAGLEIVDVLKDEEWRCAIARLPQ